MAQLPAQCADGDTLFRKITTDDFKTLMKDIKDDPGSMRFFSGFVG